MEENREEIPGRGEQQSAASVGTGAGHSAGTGSRRPGQKKSLRRAVERSLARRTGADASVPAADGYGAVADSLVRQAVDGDLKAVKLLLEILESGVQPPDREGVQVIVDV